ncbi:B3/4 domain-containing protein [Paenisporosarcina macmurdoensis]|uniref:B3/4 domain-containing protein n=1 Tax=Paenisporosarcina macmurdoensis TaxID=212659 RepID=A0ABW1L7Q2_9BACL
MKISIDPSIFQIDERIKIGINHYTKFVVSESPQMLKGRMQLYQEHLFFDLQDKELTDYPGIKEWRVLWKKFGADPGRYRPSMEAMMRRIRNQNYLQPLNSGVDLNTFFSLQYEIPVGLYDVSQIAGDSHIRLGDAETSYTGINGRDNTLSGILCVEDTVGPFGSPFVDSIRTVVNETTVEGLQIFFLQPSTTMEDAEKLIKSAGKMFAQVNGGSYSTFLLDKEHPQVSID